MQDTTSHDTTQHDPDVRWLLVIPRYPSEAANVRPYLYSHTVEVATVNEGFGDVMLLVVIGSAGRADAEYLATYQSERIRSGGYRSWVCTTYAAVRRLAETEMAEMAR